MDGVARANVRKRIDEKGTFHTKWEE